MVRTLAEQKQSESEQQPAKKMDNQGHLTLSDILDVALIAEAPRFTDQRVLYL